MSTLRGPSQLADIQVALCVPIYNLTNSGRFLMGDVRLVVGSAFLSAAFFFACSWLHSQTVRGVRVGVEEPHLRLMVWFV